MNTPPPLPPHQNIQRKFITFGDENHENHSHHHGRPPTAPDHLPHGLLNGKNDNINHSHCTIPPLSSSKRSIENNNIGNHVPMLTTDTAGSTAAPPPSLKKRKKGKGNSTKSIPSTLISDDETQHSADGEFILKAFLTAAKNKGYTESIGYGKLAKFVKEFQTHAFGSGNVLSDFSPNSTHVFQSKLSEAMKLLEKHKIHGHSPSEDIHGEEIPSHLRALVSLYTQVLQTSDGESSKTPSIPAENVTNARKYMTFMPPANGDSTREATRLDNAKAGRTLAPLDKSKSIISARPMTSKVQPIVKEDAQDDSNMILINLLSKQIEERKKKNEEKAEYSKMKITINTLKQRVKLAHDQVQYWEMKVFECDDEAKEKKAMSFLEKKQSDLTEAKNALDDALKQI